MATASLYNALPTDTTLDVAQLQVYDLSDGARLMNDVKVRQFGHQAGAQPSVAILEMMLYDGPTHSVRMENALAPFWTNAPKPWEAFGYEVRGAALHAVPNIYHEHDIAIVMLDHDAPAARRYHTVWRGTITSVNIAYEENAEVVLLYAQDVRWQLHKRHVSGGRFAPVGRKGSEIGTTAVFQHIRAILNPEGLGNSRHSSGGAVDPLWGPAVSTSASQDQRWWLAAALSMLITDRHSSLQTDGTSIPALDLPGSKLLLNNWDQPLPEIPLDGLTIAQAVDLILRSMGATWWVVFDTDSGVVGAIDATFNPVPGLYLTSLENDGPAAADYVRLPAASTTTFNTGTTWTQAGHVNYDTSDSPNVIRVIGQYEEYEASWVLTKAWSATEQAVVDAVPELGLRTSEEYALDSAAHDHVYRQWVLDEDGEYSTGGGTSQCTVIFGTSSYLRQRRRFESPYNAPEEKEKPIGVWIQATDYEEGAPGPTTWVKVGSGRIKNLRDRCGITFEMEAINTDDEARAVIKGKYEDGGEPVDWECTLQNITAVKVCAIVRSDLPVLGYVAPDVSSASRFVQEYVTYNRAWRKVVRNATSEFAVGADVTLVDQSADAQTQAAALWDALRDMRVSASVIIPWVDFGFQLHQRVKGLHEPANAGVDGRGISFIQNRSWNQPHYPRIVRITYDLEAQETELLVTDTREGRK